MNTDHPADARPENESDPPRRESRHRAWATRAVATLLAAGASAAATSGSGAASANAHKSIRFDRHGVANTEQRLIAHDDSGYILASTSTFDPTAAGASGYTNRSWFDPVTHAQRTEHITAAGIQSQEAETVTSRSGVLEWHFTQIDYATATWQTHDETNAGVFSNPTTSFGQWLLSRRTCPYSVTGQATVDAQSTLILTPVSCSAPTVWVNAATYGLVHTVQTSPQGTTTINQQWLARTPATIALTAIQIPARFTQRATLRPFCLLRPRHPGAQAPPGQPGRVSSPVT
jgi:hypothetical protein